MKLRDKILIASTLPPSLLLIMLYSLWLPELVYVLKSEVALNFRDPKVYDLTEWLFGPIVILTSASVWIFVVSLIWVVFMTFRRKKFRSKILTWYVLINLYLTLLLFYTMLGSREINTNPLTAITWLLD